MAKFREYIIKDNDTIESIALNERGSVSAWREISLINSLDFPYVIAEKEADILAARAIAASGLQTFEIETSSASAIAIPKDLILEVTREGLRDIGDRAPRYYTTSPATLQAGSLRVTVPIVCEASGDWGNTLAKTITKMVEDGNGNVLLRTGVWVAKPAVDATYNASALLNGKRRNIKTTGETILIPDGFTTTSIPPTQSYVEEFGGIDLALDANGDFVAEARTGDLATVSGYQNIAQSLLARISTRRGELKRYPYYGSNIHNYVGRAGRYVQDLIRMDIIATFKQDERVDDVTVNEFTTAGDKIYLNSVDIKLVGQANQLQLRNKAVSLV